MNPTDFFKPITTTTVEQVRKLMQEKNITEYNLVDVRQPGEYEQGHIPGAKLIPLGNLEERAGEIDPSKPTVTYCRSGNRSRAAAAMLMNLGFNDVASMNGGIAAWQGLVAGGPPEAGMAYFAVAEGPEELIGLAWLLEEGSRRFYADTAGSLAEKEASDLFRDLVKAEDHHKAALVGLYREASGNTSASTIPDSLFSGIKPGDVMEGGVSVAKALEWSRGKGMNDILDLSIALEAHAYDLYIRMEREMKSDAAKRVFQVLASEEKVHLDRMIAMLDKQRFPMRTKDTEQ